MKRSLSIILLVLSLNGLAQTDTSSRQPIDNVDIITIYKPDVAESVKIEIDPKLEQPNHPPLKYDYSFPEIAFQPKAVYSPIDPIYLKPEKREDLYDNYVEFGMGNYLTTFLDARIHNTQDKYYTYGLHLKHHASSLSNDPNQGLFSENRVTAFGKREKGGTLYGEIDYRRNVIHHYGYDTTLAQDLELRDINQIYNDIRAKIDWSKSGRIGESSVSAGFDLFDRLNGNENSISIENNNKIKTPFGAFYIDLGLWRNSINREVSYTRVIGDVKPHVEFKYKKLYFDLGVRVNYLNDSNTSKLYYAPYARAHTFIVPKKLRVYIGLDGGLQRNSLRSMTYENMFIGSNPEIKTTQDVFQLFGGMNGNFDRFVEYGIRFAHRIVDNQYFFITDSNHLRSFATEYDGLGITSFAGELKLDVNENLDFGFAGTAYVYNTNTLSNAYHMPSYDAKIFATVRLSDKIYISGAYFAIGPRQAKDLKNNERKLEAINDVNLGLEYRYKKNISGFINVQNLLHQKYEIWNHYRSQGINIMAGVTISI